jgi:hypothetical protein
MYPGAGSSFFSSTVGWTVGYSEGRKSLSLSLEGGGRRMPSNISKNPGALNCDKERKTQKHTQQCYALARMQDAVEMQYGMEAMHTIYSKGPMGRDG